MNPPSTIYAIGTLLIGGVMIVVHTRGMRGAFFAPFNLTLLVLVATFAIHPMFLIADDDFVFYDRFIQRGFNQATIIGLFAMVALVAGYLTAGRRLQDHEWPDSISDPNPAVRYSMYRASALSTVLVGAWLALMISRGGGVDFLSVLFEGRNPDTARILSGLPVFVGALPTTGAIVVSSVRLSTERERPLHLGEKTAFYAVVLISLVPPMALGGRRYLLPCVLAAAIAITARSYRKAIRARHLALATGGFLFLAVVPFVRSTGSRGANSANVLAAMFDYINREGVLGAMRPFFTSYDTENFDYIAVLAPRLNPDDIPFGLGRGTIRDLLLNPLPADASPVPLWSDQVLTRIFGGGCAEVYCPVGSYVGVLYVDFWFVGVVLGSFALGYACRRYPKWLALSKDSRLLLLVTISAFTPVLVRGNTTNVLYIALIVGLFGALVLRLCRDKLPSSRTRVRRRRPEDSRPVTPMLRGRQATPTPHGAGVARLAPPPRDSGKAVRPA